MYLTGYVKEFGKYSFEERPFTDVDAAILATVSYANLEVIAPMLNGDSSFRSLFKNISKFDMSVVVAGKILVRDRAKLIPAMRDSKRFGDIAIKYIVKKFDPEQSKQFYAATFEIPGVGHYVAFRGTDTSVIGWKEDLSSAVKNVLGSQLDAVNYLEEICNRVEGPIYVGGHSKGGNNVLYTITHCSKKTRDRIVKSYSFDGNGLNSPDFYDSPEYLEIKDRHYHYCPYDTIVSTIMHNPRRMRVVKSRGVFAFQHDTNNWKIDKKTGKFVRSLDVSNKAYIRYFFIQQFLNENEHQDKSALIEYIFTVLGGSKSTIWDFFLSFGKIQRVRDAWKKLTEQEKQCVKNAVRSLKKCSKKAKQIRKERKEKIKALLKFE